jgi:peptidoglycan/LPS O-acetylase OafA/YrhL
MRRLFPALVVSVFVAVAMGFFILLPEDYLSLTRSAVYQQLMLANVFFWKWSGYFDGSSELKPLLHMWSLAVEEQFYVCLPILLYLSRGASMRTTGLILSVVAMMSLFLSQVILPSDQNFSFFMLPTRAWELLFGSLIWWIPKHEQSEHPRQQASLASNLVAIVFLSVILITGFCYRSTTPFPGINAIAPVFCTTGLIYLHAGRETVVSKFFENKLIVFIGLVSYSWYLWHWPIIAYANYVFGFEHSIAFQTLIVLASFGIACLSYWYIENPFRKGRLKRLGFTKLLYAAIASLLIIFSVDFWVRSTEGAAFRLPERIRNLDLIRGDIVLSEQDGVLFKDGKDKLRGIGKKSIVGPDDPIDFLVWGDSHARMLHKSLESIATHRNLQGVVAAKSGTGPFASSYHEDTVDWGEMTFELLSKRKIRKVLLVGKWDGALMQNLKGERVKLQKLVRFLREKGTEVGILLQVPRQKFDPTSAWVRSRVFLSEIPKGISLEEYEKGSNSLNGFFGELSEFGVAILDVKGICFDDSGFSKIGNSDVCYYWDDDHLSIEGVRELLEPILLEWIER